jgi:carboxymethylenebutenolidase
VTLTDPEFVDIPTAYGPMRTHLFRPKAQGKYPAILLFSEIYQITGPIRRFAAALAGNGFVVAAPEVYHEFEPAGTALAYDVDGTARGNELKYTKELASYDADARALVEFLPQQEYCSGSFGAIGVCLGGHLALRAALNPEIAATACLYPTDVHTGTLGLGKKDDTLVRLGEVKGELTFIWGRQDPHIPREGRRLIYDRLTDLDLRFEWHEFNAAHAFIRDEGPRYDAALARLSMEIVLNQFHRAL